MKRILTIATALVLSVMSIASLASSDIGFTLMMSDSPEHNIARMALIGTLSSLTVIRQPRSRICRIGLASIATGIVAYTLAQTANFGLQLFDTLAYALVAVILMTESLENEQAIVLSSRSRRIVS